MHMAAFVNVPKFRALALARRQPKPSPACAPVCASTFIMPTLRRSATFAQAPYSQQRAGGARNKRVCMSSWILTHVVASQMKCDKNILNRVHSPVSCLQSTLLYSLTAKVLLFGCCCVHVFRFGLSNFTGACLFKGCR